MRIIAMSTEKRAAWGAVEKKGMGWIFVSADSLRRAAYYCSKSSLSRHGVSSFAFATRCDTTAAASIAELSHRR
jgi:hypothetical protein